MKTFYLKSVLTGVLLTSSILLFGSATETSPVSKPSFQENKGQISDQFYKARPDVLFSGTDEKLVYHLKQTGISYQLTQVSSWKNAGIFGKNFGRSVPDESRMPAELTSYRIDISWINCNPKSAIVKGETRAGFDNFYLESCPNGATEVKSYADVTYKNLYPGIDLKWYEKNGHLKYDYAMAAGADYTQLKLEFNGAQNIRIGKNGQLIISTPLGELTEEAPRVEQGGRLLASHWQINGNVVSFFITGIDSKKPYTIDPLVRLWGTFYGGSGTDWTFDCSVDIKGYLYSAGAASSANLQSIATVGAYQTTMAGGTGGDAFLVKFNPAGVRQWGTYFGGTGTDYAYACRVDTMGDIYMSGGTTSTNSAVMTTPGCYQSVYGGGGSASSLGDIMLAKFNASGLRIWSTYAGGAGDEATWTMTNDFQNNIYITGQTTSLSTTGIASPSSHQPALAGGTDAFLMKFDPSGVRLWGTYYGGNGNDGAGGCTTDALGNVYMGGISTSTASISTPGSHQPSYGGSTTSGAVGPGDAFLVKFNSSGVRQWGTYYGGTGNEVIYSCATDPSGNIYFSGTSTSINGTTIASPGSHQPNFGAGGSDAMLVKFNSAGIRQWGTYYGTLVIEYGAGISIDKLNGYIYFSGETAFNGTSAGTTIATPCAYQYTYGGGSQDAFLTKFDFQGQRIWGTYYGGNGLEDWTSVAVDGLGAVYMVGETSTATGTVMSSAGAHQTAYGGGSYDGFIVKFDGCKAVTPSAVATSTVCKGYPMVLSSSQTCGLKWYSDSTLANLIYSGGNFTTNAITSDTIFYYVDVSCGSASAKSVAHVTVIPGPTISIFTTYSVICKGETTTLVPVGANNYTWSNSSSPYTITVSPSVTTVYSVSGTTFNGGCATNTTLAIQVNECLGLDQSTVGPTLNLQIFPNPSETSFTVSGNKTSELLISNQLGEVVRQVQLEASNQFKVTIDDLPNGIYFIRARSESAVSTGKVIVLK
ncbi:MAG: T9SS type A sorting domain-containing protein [bacterium]|nr:T9SS type A sorting domain-containing protein [bacterium]